MKFDLATFAWQIVNFLVLLAILNKLLYKPMLNMLAERKRTIKDSLEKAEAARAEADKLQSQYQAQLLQAKREAQEIIEKATKMGEDMKEDIVKNAKNEADKAIKKAQDEISREKNQAVAALREEVATLAVLAAGKVVGKAITVQDHEQMVKEFIAEAGDLKC
ncbi:MAG: F0F1 ATP synthase subunit B [Clostridia bacterium]|nr:F0F1 ATP synthase subunit B [Clostridia bacterium]